MNKEILPYLNSLYYLLTSISDLKDLNKDVSLRIDLSKRLVDLLLVHHEVLKSLKVESFNKIPAIFLELKKLLPKSKNNELLLEELKQIADDRHLDNYEKFLEISGKIQRQLIQINSTDAIKLSKILLQIEVDYCQQLFNTISAQNSISHDSSESGSARNIRAFEKQDMVNFIQDQFPKETEVMIKNTSFIAGGYSKYTADINLSKTKSLPQNIILRGDANGGFGGMSVVDEYNLLSSLYQNEVCVPEPFAVDKNDSVFGSPFILMEKLPGTCIGHMFDIPPIKSESLVIDIAKKLSRIHLIPLKHLNKNLDGANCLSSEKAISWISSSENSWLELDLPSQVFSTAFEWLRRNAKIYDNGPRSLVHGDYGINNLLIEDEHVSGILDWEHAHIGNTSYDLGYFHPMADALASWSIFLDAYANTRAPMPEEDQINYSILLGATRVGVMVCQVRSAFLKNQETGIAASIGIAGDYYDTAVLRISNALEKVL